MTTAPSPAGELDALRAANERHQREKQTLFEALQQRDDELARCWRRISELETELGDALLDRAAREIRSGDPED